MSKAATQTAAPEPKAKAQAGVMLWSPSGDCHIGLTSGHTFVVPGNPQGIMVPQKFRKAAISKQCIAVGEEPDEEAQAGPMRERVIGEKMRAMLASDDPNYFSADGKPQLAVLEKLCGFPVDRKERDVLWKIVEDNPDGDEG